MSQPNVQNIDLPLQVTGLIVGKKGAKINSIKARSKAYVHLSPEPLPSNPGLKRLVIKGSNAEVAKAEELVYEVLCSWCSVEGQEENIQLLPQATRDRVQEILTSQTENSTPNQQNNVKEQGNHHPKSKRGGSRQNAQNSHHDGVEDRQRAQGQGQHQSQDAKSNQNHFECDPDEEVHQEMDVPNAYMSVLTSNHGQHIASVELITKAKVAYAAQQPDPSLQLTKIVIYGRFSQVQGAYQMLQQLLHRLQFTFDQYAQHVQQVHFQQANVPVDQYGVPAGPNVAVSGYGGQQQMMPMGGAVPNVAHPPMNYMAPAQQPNMPYVYHQQQPQQQQQQQPQQQQPQQQQPQQQPQQQQQQQQQPPANQASSMAQSSEEAQGNHQPQRNEGSKRNNGGHVPQDSQSEGVHQTGVDQNNQRQQGKREAQGQGKSKMTTAVELSVPAGAAGMIVGKRAAMLKKFKADTGARVQLKAENTSEEVKIVQIDGGAAAVERAVHMLIETLTLWSQNEEAWKDKDAEHWKDYLLSQYSKQKQNQQQAQQQNQQQANEKAQGRPPQAQLRPGTIQEFLEDQREADKLIRIEMQIPVTAAGMIVGKQGKTIKNIHHRTGATVALVQDVNPEDETKKVLAIQGKKSQVKLARDLVIDLMLTWLKNAQDEQGGGPGAKLHHLASKIQERIAPVVTKEAQKAQNQGQKHEQAAPASSVLDELKGIEIPGVILSGEEEHPRVEFLVSIATAAMIIGKKGMMLKQLQHRSGAKISLDSVYTQEGKKQVVIEGKRKTVLQASRMIKDIIDQCDEAKYEEAARMKQQEEEKKKKALEEQKKKQEAKVQETESKSSSAPAEESEESRKKDDERKWLEKKERAAKKTENEKKLKAKIAQNVYAFLDDDEEHNEAEEEEAEADAGNSPGKKADSASNSKKKKKKVAKAAPAQPSEGASQSKEEDNQELSDSDEERGGESKPMIGLDAVLKMQEELETVENNMEFSVSNNTKEALQIKVGYHSRRGQSHANEDQFAVLEFLDLIPSEFRERLLESSTLSTMPFFAVFDGHGGAGVSGLAQKVLAAHVADALTEKMRENVELRGREAREELIKCLEEGFARTEKEALELNEKGDKSGSCATCCMLCDNDGDICLYVANLGDCRIVLGKRENGALSAVRLTTDHRAVVASERQRIEGCGGKVEDKRAMGDLIPSRAFGDSKTKGKCPGAVIAVPEVTKHSLQKGEDECIILASDGLWDDLKLSRVMDLLNKYPNPASAVKAITQAVIKKYGVKCTKPTDDLTVIVVHFEWP